MTTATGDATTDTKIVVRDTGNADVGMAAVGTGLMPASIAEDPDAFEIIAMTNTGFDSEYVTAGFYRVRPSILAHKQDALDKKFTALRQYRTNRR